MLALTSAQKRKARELCKNRDGDKCSIGIKCNNITGDEYRAQTGHDFDLHHKDRNRSNNPKDGSNHALACHPCNCAADPRGKTTRPKFSAFKPLKNRLKTKTNKYGKSWSPEQLEKMPSQMKASYDYKQKFPEVLAVVMNSDEILVEIDGRKVAIQEDVVDTCAHEIGCSPEVALKYLRGECSLFGEYERVGINELNKLVPIRFIERPDKIFIAVKQKKQEQPDEKKIIIEIPKMHTNGNGVHHED
jgi:hypothetical protein